MLESRCAICSDPGKRAAVNRALQSGDTPATVLRDLGGTLGISPSSLYRHARLHASAGLTPAWVGPDTTTGEVVSDLATLRRSLIEQRADALAHGNHNAAAAVAGRIESVSVSLLREAHVSEESQARDLAAVEKWMWIVGRSIFARPELADDLAAAADDLGHDALASDIRQTADSARAHAGKEQHA